MTARWLFATIVQLALVFASGSEDHHDHGHASSTPSTFEWGGIFKTPEDNYLWTAQKTVQKDGHVKYADPKMKMVVLKVASATDAALDAAKEEAAHGFQTNCTEVEAGESITPKEDACFELHFKESWWQTLFNIDAAGADYLAIFAEHFPTEFENTAHYLKDDHGHDVEPVHSTAEEHKGTEASKADDDPKPWGAAIGAAICVNIVTLSGVVFAVPIFRKIAKTHAVQFEAIMSGFAAGALLACAFFLLLFESTHLIATGYTSEVDTIWRWGSMILAGFLLPAVIQLVSHEVGVLIGRDKKCEECIQPDGENPAGVVDAADVEVKVETSAAGEMAVRSRLIGGVLIGDFFHNLCDGIFIGLAFTGCGDNFGWTVALGTVIHEVSQELADYVILTGCVAKLRPVIALVCNFISGLSVILGVVIALSSEVGNESNGLLLAFGGGVYLHLAATECMPRLYNSELSRRVRAISLLMFVVGAVAIGLILLDHEHCVPPNPDGTAADPHAGHGH